MPGSIEELWPHALEIFKDASYILHAGDLHTLDIVDRLSDIAPTYVSRGNGDVGIVDERLQDTWILDLEGITIGMIHHFPSPLRKSASHLEKHLDKNFDGKAIDVVVYGHTHLEDVRAVSDRLYINPGSPTLPRNQLLRPGTLGMLELDDSHVTATIYQLTDHSVIYHEEIDPLRHPY